MPQLEDLISFDNLNDPLPVWNHEATIYGIVISFLVREPFFRCAPWPVPELTIS